MSIVLARRGRPSGTSLASPLQDRCARAKDPKSTQAHMRHTDPYITLKHYQREVPAEVKALALAYERDLLDVKRKREEAREASSKNLPII